VSKIKPGRWHVVCGGCQQTGGYPPNVTYVDYVKVASVTQNGIVTLDRKLRFGYSPTWYEDPSDDKSWGVGRIVPYDTGGTGGVSPGDPRIGHQWRFINLEFRTNPITKQDITCVQGCIDMSSEGCNICNLQSS